MSRVAWIARQLCSDCGEGEFRRTEGGLMLCTECEHEHPLDPHNLGEGERFDMDDSGFLVVIATEPEEN